MGNKNYKYQPIFKNLVPEKFDDEDSINYLIILVKEVLLVLKIIMLILILFFIIKILNKD